MKFNVLYEQTMRKFSDGSLAENIAYEIAYGVTTEKMPLIIADNPHDDAYGYWNYEVDGEKRVCQYTVHVYRNNIVVECYISTKGSNLDYDKFNDIPHTNKSWKFKTSSKSSKIEEISKYLNKAMLADKRGKTIRE